MPDSFSSFFLLNLKFLIELSKFNKLDFYDQFKWEHIGKKCARYD